MGSIESCLGIVKGQPLTLWHTRNLWHVRLRPGFKNHQKRRTCAQGAPTGEGNAHRISELRGFVLRHHLTVLESPDGFVNMPASLSLTRAMSGACNYSDYYKYLLYMFKSTHKGLSSPFHMQTMDKKLKKLDFPQLKRRNIALRLIERISICKPWRQLCCYS